MENFDSIVDALVKNHGFGKEKAIELIHKHIDVVEVNEEESPDLIALKLEDEYLNEN
jgi:hypothetical protein